MEGFDLYGLIVSPGNVQEVKEAIKGSEVWFEKIGIFNPDTFVQHCQAAAAVNMQALIIDATCIDDSSLIKGIRQFRLKRGATRIVLIAPGREPGDVTISTLLKLQVFDFVAPKLETLEGDEDEDSDDLDDDLDESDEDQKDPPNERMPLSHYIKQQLLMRPEYSNAARWDLGVDEVGTVQNKQDTGKGKEKQETNQSAKLDQTLLKEIHDIEIEPPPIKEKQTLVETIIGTVVIAVIGVEEAVGTTHTALLVTNFIARKGRKVAIIEANDHRDFAKIEAAYEGMIGSETDVSIFSISGVDYYKSSYKYNIAELLEQNYDYIVLDLGDHHSSHYLEEFYRAHVQLVIGHGSEWRQHRLFEFAEEHGHRDQANWIFCIPHVEEVVIGDIQKELHEGKIHAIPSHPDPYRINKGTDSTLERFLKEYIGKKRNKNRQWIIYSVMVAIIILLIILLAVK